MSYSTQGASNKQIYDCCAYAQALQQSVDPLQYQMYFGAHENCSKCIDHKAWFKQDKEIVDIESDLWNLTRPLSKCDGYKYNPNCKTGPYCTSTFDPNIPRVLSPSLCPIVYNNIPVQTAPGYSMPNTNICSGKNDWTVADKVNTYQAYDQSNRSIIANSNEPQDVFMFMNSCSNKPLYQGGKETVRPFNTNIYNSAPVQSNMRGIPDGAYNLNTDTNARIEQMRANQMRLNQLAQVQAEGEQLQGVNLLGSTNNVSTGYDDSDDDYDSDSDYESVV